MSGVIHSWSTNQESIIEWEYKIFNEYKTKEGFTYLGKLEMEMSKVWTWKQTVISNRTFKQTEVWVQQTILCLSTNYYTQLPCA